MLDDFRGTVTRIGMRTTSIMDPGGNIKIVNNSDIRNLQNRSQEVSLAIVDLGISYGQDLKKAEELIMKALPAMLEKNSDVFLEEPSYMGVEEFGDSAVILRFLVKTNEENFFVARRRLNRELRLLFAAANIEIPFQQVVVHNED